MRRPHAGHASAEFLLACGALAAALLLPYVNGESVATLLLRALMAGQRTQSFVFSIL